MSIVGVVRSLARYPVKSVLGEELDEAELEARGVVGDRCWAFYTEDGGIGSGKTSQRFRRVDGLLGLRSSLTGDVPELHLPDGRTVRVDDPGAGEVLGGLLGRAVTPRRETTVPHHDDAPVHLVTTAGLRALGTEAGGEVDPVRFRANLVLDVEGAGYAEDRWVGRELAIGDEVVLGIEFGMPRCVMVDAVHGGRPAEPRVLTTLGRAHDVEFGLAATVARGGTIRRGDAARLVEAG